MTDYKWPEVVPILDSDEFCKGTLHDGKGRMCLMGHALSVFGDGPWASSLPCEVFFAIRAEMREHGYDDHITAFNDAPGRRYATLAKVWNGAMKRLGYTEVIDRE